MDFSNLGVASHWFPVKCVCLSQQVGDLNKSVGYICQFLHPYTWKVDVNVKGLV
jgi:hypothetical protein